MDATVLAKAASPVLSGLIKGLPGLVKLAERASPLEQRVVLYLRVAQNCVDGLGRERQQILRDASLCNVRKASEVEALWKRMNTYLHEDNIRDHFQKAVDGLRGCHATIEAKAQQINWRGKRDKQAKQAAAKEFSRTLNELENQLRKLKSTFYPWGSGVGVKTLKPIYALLTGLRDGHKKKNKDYDTAEEELRSLIRKALEDVSNSEWLSYSGQVERLVTELQLAFRWREDLRAHIESQK